jgi:hypothetical protein
MLFGAAANGRSWLPKRVRWDTPAKLPTTFLDVAGAAGGQRLAFSSAAPCEIRREFGWLWPHLDLASHMMCQKRSMPTEASYRVSIHEREP